MFALLPSLFTILLSMYQWQIKKNDSIIKSEIKDITGLHDVLVKVEPLDQEKEREPMDELYADHEVKEEMVIGPAVLQKPGPSAKRAARDVTASGSAPKHQSQCGVCGEDIPSSTSQTLTQHKCTCSANTSLCYDKEQREQKIISKTPTTKHKLAVPAYPDGGSVPSCSAAQPKRLKRFLGSERDTEPFLTDSGSELESDDNDDFYTSVYRQLKMEQSMQDEESGKEEEPAGSEAEGEEEVAGSVVVCDGEEVAEGKDEVPEHRDRGVAKGPTLSQAGLAESADDFSWSEDYSTFSGKEEVYVRHPGPTTSVMDPTDLFEAIWDRPIIEDIVAETNKYAMQKLEEAAEIVSGLTKNLMTWRETTVAEIYTLLALLILMPFCDRSREDEYWTTGILEMPKFRSIISRNRYHMLMRFLHFVDNNDTPRNLSTYWKKIHKISPVLSHCNKKFQSLYIPKKQLCLDESLLLWKGRLSWVQCFRTKAARFGIKSFDLCESQSGYLLRTILYAGKGSSSDAGLIHGFKNATSKIVLRIMDGLLDFGHSLFMDSWYNQLALTRFLKTRKTDVIGTLNRRQQNVPDEINSINMERMRRGERVSRHCGDISVVAWMDSKLVTTVSTFHTDDMVHTKRADQSVWKPIVISDFNKHMGGVDRKDQMLSMFLIERNRGNKWYVKVFKRLLNTSLLNAFILHQNTWAPIAALSQRDFRVEVAKGLLDRYNVPRVAERTTSSQVRLNSSLKHYPMKCAPRSTRVKGNKPKLKQRRCARCSAKGKATFVTTQCRACDAGLCIDVCWVEYHELPDLN